MCGNVKMVDITEKDIVVRTAAARGRIRLKPETVNRIKRGLVEKGNVLEIAKIAAIIAAKKTSEIIPLCHPIPITNIEVNTIILDDENIEVETIVKAEAKTGVEMEAITATAIALVTIWDMVKMYEKDDRGEYPKTKIEEIRVEWKVKESKQ
ncbi:MAG: cyclic pyranopterin monophosphate synthase MoaC [Candidatus Methanomethylicia archaeon]